MFLILVAAVLFMQQSYGGENNQLRWMSFNDGIAEAKKTGKKVMIDVYTNWCGWCKKMDKETYTNVGVVDYLNRYFVVVKLDLKGTGDPITTYPGYADAATFKTVASFIAEDHYLTKKFEDYARSTR
jgi:thioredoxin-related protein